MAEEPPKKSNFLVQLFRWLTETPDIPDVEVYQDTLTDFQRILMGLGVLSFIRMLMLRGNEALVSGIVAAILGGGFLLTTRLRDKGIQTSWFTLILVAVVAIGVEAWGFSEGIARYYYPLAVFVSSLLVSRSVVVFVTVFAGLVHLGVSLLLGKTLEDYNFIWGPMLLMVVTAIISWLTSRQLRTALESAQTYYARTRDMLLEIRNQRAELTQTVKALGVANTRLAKVNEELDAARQVAEQADKIKSEFLAHMSHELRTPLNAILNFTAFVSDGLMGEVNTEQVEALQRVTDSANHLLSLINDVLDISKIQSGMMSLFVEEVYMNEALRATVSIAKGLVKNKPIELNVEIEENLPHIYGDKRRIRQILLNLVSNAVKFTQKGGVTITAQHHHETNEVYISVSDTGVGIPAEDLDMVFLPFRQSQQGVEQVVGTGLGLPITKHFVEAHGGKIWVESEAGKGTIFHVSLPVENDELKLSVEASATGVK